MHIQPLQSDLYIIPEVIEQPTPEKITELTKALLYENSRGVRKDLSRPALFDRIAVLEQLSSEKLSPKRSNLLWCFHVATFGLSYGALKLYDYSKATKILHQKELLLKNYIQQIFLPTAEDPAGVERINTLLAPLDGPSKKEVLKEILIFALKNKNSALIKTCRTLLPQPVTFAEHKRTMKLWKQAIDGGDVIPTFNREAIDKILSNGEDVNVILTMEGNLIGTPLLIATRYGKIDVAKELIAAGADINVQDNKGMTPLMWAIKNNDVYFACDLLRAGAIPNMRDHKGNTALMHAASHSFSDISINALLDAGADVNIPNTKGDTVLSELIRNSKDSNRLPVGFEKILAAHPNLDVLDHHGDTPLIWATFRDNPHIVSALLAAGANPEIQDRVGKRTALMSAINYRSYSAIGPLLAARQNLNLQDYAGTTALLFASKDRNFKAVRALIQAGADVTIKDTRGDGVDRWVLDLKREAEQNRGVRPHLQQELQPNRPDARPPEYATPSAPPEEILEEEIGPKKNPEQPIGPGDL